MDRDSCPFIIFAFINNVCTRLTPAMAPMYKEIESHALKQKQRALSMNNKAYYLQQIDDSLSVKSLRESSLVFFTEFDWKKQRKTLLFQSYIVSKKFILLKTNDMVFFHFDFY